MKRLAILRDQSASAAAEMALVTPLLLALLFRGVAQRYLPPTPFADPRDCGQDRGALRVLALLQLFALFGDAGFQTVLAVAVGNGALFQVGTLLHQPLHFLFLLFCRRDWH